MIFNENTVWAGSERALALVMSAEEAIANRISAGFMPEEDEEDVPRLLTVDEHGLATVSIKGPLVNSASWWNQLFGLTGYPEIRDALMHAAENPDVKHILLDIDSGGGAVSGCDDTGKLIRMIDANVKPVTTFSDSTMASAAYWLGAAAGSVYAGKTALVGSIGVIAVHKEAVEAYKKEGIGVTVVRAGKEKALANPNEKLSDKGREQIQQAVDATYGVFVEHVAEMRGKTEDYVRTQMADGKEFIGASAADVGLVDKITTYDEVVSDIHRQLIDRKGSAVDTRGRFAAQAGVELTGEANMATTKRALTEQDLAALASGAQLSADAEAGAAAEAAAEAAAAEASEGGDEGATDEAAAGTGSGDQAAVQGNAQDVATLQGQVVLLNSQLSAGNEALIAARLEVTKLTDKVAALEAVVEPLKAIVASSVNNMSVALNSPPLDLSGLTGAEVVARHQAVAEQFKSKFKVGGVAAVTGEDAQPKQPQVDPRHLARVNAARFNPSK